MQTFVIINNNISIVTIKTTIDLFTNYVFSGFKILNGYSESDYI